MGRPKNTSPAVIAALEIGKKKHKVVAVPAKQPKKAVDLSTLLKDRYHHRLTYEEIGRKYGVSGATVHERLQKFTKKLGDPEEQNAFAELEGTVQTAIREKFSSHLLEMPLDKVGAKEAALVYGIAYDKHRLHTGQATSHVSVFFNVVAESDTKASDEDVIEAEIEPAE